MPAVRIALPQPSPREPTISLARPLFALLFAATLGAGAPGCVSVYHPLSGQHRPVIVDPAGPNLRGVELVVRCIPGGLHTPAESRIVCERLGDLFTNQGARVTAYEGTSAPPDDPAFGDPLEGEPLPADATPVKLTLDVRGRVLHRASYPLSWALCFASFTLVPGISEISFAQDLEIRDDTGFLLARESIRGRRVHRFGAGTWAGTTIVDWMKPKDERLMRGAFAKDLSGHLYGQVSQILFDARMAAEVLLASPSGVR